MMRLLPVRLARALPGPFFNPSLWRESHAKLYLKIRLLIWVNFGRRVPWYAMHTSLLD
jgi:hypothetical protein